MKKFLLYLLCSLVLVLPVSAYVVKSGDTPYGLWGINWKTELAKYGITDPRKLPVGLEVGEQKLGLAPIDVIALYEDNLQNGITSADTSLTLVRGTDKQGRAINGTFGFIIDEGTTLEEFIIAYCSSTACSNVQRGIDVADGKTEVASLKKAHRKGASIKQTNYPILGRLNNIIVGKESTGSSTFMIGDDTNQLRIIASTTKTIYSWGNTGNPFLRYNGINWQFSDDGVNTTNLVTGGGGLSASSSLGVQVVDSKIGINASSTTGLQFDGSGKVYQGIASTGVDCADWQLTRAVGYYDIPSDVASATIYMGLWITSNTSTIPAQYQTWFAQMDACKGSKISGADQGKYTLGKIKPLYYSSSLINGTQGTSINYTKLISNIATSTPTANIIPISNSSGLLDSWITKNYTKTNLLVSESVAEGNALYVNTGSSTVLLYTLLQDSNFVNFDPYTLEKYGQTFTTNVSTKKISSILFHVEERWGGGSFTGVISIYATSGGLPTGVALWSSGYTKPNGSTAVTVYPNLTVNTSTMYAFVVSADNFGGVTQSAAIYSNQSYSGGTWIQTLDNGVTYTTSSADYASTIYLIDGVAGGIYKTTALTNTDRVNNFIGFAATSANTSSYVDVITSGAPNIFSGLTPGSKYYISDAFGSISSSVGTVTKTIGLAINSSTLLIKNDN